MKSKKIFNPLLLDLLTMITLRGGERKELKTNKRNDSFQTNEIFTEYSQVPGQQESSQTMLSNPNAT